MWIINRIDRDASLGGVGLFLMRVSFSVSSWLVMLITLTCMSASGGLRNVESGLLLMLTIFSLLGMVSFSCSVVRSVTVVMQLPQVVMLAIALGFECYVCRTLTMRLMSLRGGMGMNVLCGVVRLRLR